MARIMGMASRVMVRGILPLEKSFCWVTVVPPIEISLLWYYNMIRLQCHSFYAFYYFLSVFEYSFIYYITQ